MGYSLRYQQLSCSAEHPNILYLVGLPQKLVRFFVKGGKPPFKFDLWRVDLSHAQATTPNGLPTRASTREEREERRESWRSESHKASRGRVRFQKEKPPPCTQEEGGFCFCFLGGFFFFSFRWTCLWAFLSVGILMLCSPGWVFPGFLFRSLFKGSDYGPKKGGDFTLESVECVHFPNSFLGFEVRVWRPFAPQPGEIQRK